MSAPAPPTLDAAPADLAAWNRELNRTHAMAAMRARAGRVVTTIEERRRGLVAARVRRLTPRVVLDVGCEDGWIAAAYVEAVERLVLADVDPAVLGASPLADHPRVQTVVADALAPAPLAAALGAAGADVIVLSALLEHLPDPSAALRALAPLLARGGRFLLYVPADGPILFAKGLLRRTRLGGLLRGLSLDPAPGHLQRFARRDVAALLRPHAVLESLSFDPVCLGYLAMARRR